MPKTVSIIIGLILFNIAVFAQTAPFNIQIEPFNITSVGGLQAYAIGQNNGKWLIIGGRLDGLHRRQPFAAFDVAGNNNQLIVIDPISQQKWTAPLTSLSVSLQEQLSSTNMEFHQDGNYLYIIGGYGYNTATASRKTFDKLTAVDVPAVIDAVIGATPFTSYFRQITDVQFAVTGGQVKKINNTYYLVGGNKFDGNYNAFGNPSYTQVYTDAIRKFNISDNGTIISITHLPTITDAANLHRRDYNAVPQILPNGSEGITAFSGVFQATVNLPFLNSVTIDSVGYSVNNSFQQYYNHYHCAVLPIYSASNNEMHNVFFGGIAQFYDSSGVMIQDDNVPFVKTIARVTRDSNGTLTEYKLPIEMPSLLGAGSEFIRIESIPQYNNEVFKLDDFTADTTLVGYIFGGISSTAANIFFTNTGTQSSASNQIFKVYVIKDSTACTIPNQNIIGDTEICQSEPTTLTASGGASYLWSTSDTSASINITDLLFTTAYYVTVTDSTGNCSSDTSIIVNVQIPDDPIFSFTTAYCQGEQADTLPNISDNGINGIWFPTTINTSSTDTIQYDFMPLSNECANNYNVDIAIGGIELNEWIGTSGNWNDSNANWSRGRIPRICDNVVIPASVNVAIQANEVANCATLQVDTLAIFTVHPTATLTVEND